MLGCDGEGEFLKMVGRFRGWVEGDGERSVRYWRARGLGVDARVERVMVGGGGGVEDVGRETLEFAKVKWDAGNMNRKRYGAVLEVNQSISITAALLAAQGRLIEHEETRLLEGE
jgi:hypothetical protein